MKILENDLPPHLSAMDRHTRVIPDAKPSLLETRRNVFDGDAFDVFTQNTLPQDQVIRGKKPDSVLVEDAVFTEKQRMFLSSSLFQEDDDEYDDTYDSSDVRYAGTIEAHMLDEEDPVEVGIFSL